MPDQKPTFKQIDALIQRLIDTVLDYHLNPNPDNKKDIDVFNERENLREKIRAYGCSHE